MPISIFDILKLTPAERLQLIEDIWDGIATAPESVKVTDAQRAELNHRLEAFRANPDAGDSWETVNARITRKTETDI